MGLLDFLLDCVFVSSSINSDSPAVVKLGFAAIGFVLLPFLLNLAFATRVIRKELDKNGKFSQGFGDKATPFILLVVLTCTNSVRCKQAGMPCLHVSI